MTPRETPSIRVILREFPSFLARPRKLEPSGLRAPGAPYRLLVLIALYVAVLLGVMLPFLHLWQSAFDLPSPDAFGELPPAMLAPVAILIAPVAEEMLFRGWLTGRPRALWLLLCALAFGAVLYGSTAGMEPALAGLGLIVLLIAAPLGWFLLRKRAAPGWFAAGFPGIFYLTAVLFSLVHMTNYPSFSVLALPLVLPQLWAGLVLGFIRMRIGLIASMIAHGTANAAALGLAVLLG